jgi:penicillin-binding protein 2
VASDGRVLEETPSAPEVIRNIDVDPAILERVKRSMVGVVEDKRGTGHKAALPETAGISVGGKTGTAQVASKESGIKDDDHAWFAGFAPAENPQIVVVALVENGGHGGATAAPLAHDMFATYFGIPVEPVEAPQVSKKKVSGGVRGQR